MGNQRLEKCVYMCMRYAAKSDYFYDVVEIWYSYEQQYL